PRAFSRSVLSQPMGSQDPEPHAQVRRRQKGRFLDHTSDLSASSSQDVLGSPAIERVSDNRQPGWEDEMRRYVLVVPLFLVLADCASEPAATPSQAQIPAVASGTARLWFLRGWDAPSGQNYVFAAAPEIYANGAPVGDLPVGTIFFRDFAPGTYKF